MTANRIIGTLCRGHGGADVANITNIMANCGFLYGAPLRKDGVDSSLFDPGSAWSIPMYSCASTTKSVIKTVSFRFNGTKDDLSSLEVVSLKDQTYGNEDSKPLWGVENTTMTFQDGNPLWGIVSKDSEKKLNLTTIRKETLYLPGQEGPIGFRNTPGADFASIALDMAYSTGFDTSNTAMDTVVDYSGRSNLAMYKKWQELCRTPSTSAKILNLIWTDIAANMVVGTKSLGAQEGAGKRKRDTTSTLRTPPVVNYDRRVKYKYPYGLPAFLALVLFAATSASTLFFMCFSGAGISTIRTYLQHTSTGRILVSHASAKPSETTMYRGHSPVPHDDTYTNAPTDVWAKGVGQQKFTLGAEGWMKNVDQPDGYDNKGGLVARYAPVPYAPNGQG